MWKRAATLLICLLPFAATARAWDQTGHKVVAYIAWEHMSAEARDAVSRILGMAPPRSGLLDLRPAGGPGSDMVHFMRASYWPDLVRDRDQEERYALYHRGSWHYTNIFWEDAEDGGVRVREDLLPDEENVVERLHFLERLARHELVASAQKAVVIAWLAHLVGDIHQPLHTSARVTSQEPEGDRGGNLFGLAGEDNLHWYWDRALTDAFEREVGETEIAYVRRIAESLTAQHPQPPDVTFDYDGWAQRGFRIASRDVYAEVQRGESPPVAYAEMAQATAAESVALAGYRLAALMNSIFG